MKILKGFIPFLLMITLFSQCKKDTSSGVWAIPSDEVFDGGPGKDGIPSVDDPEFRSVSEINYMNDDDLVLGFKVGNEVRAYTHPVLDWHEIVNDEVNGVAIAITYCPLTGTGIGWDRNINGEVTTFGVSGLLYNSNLIPYDRKSDSNWSQMANECVNGELIDTPIETHLLVETTWKTWQEFYPNSSVLTTNTGFSRSYGTYPYGNYITSSNLNFPISVSDDRLHVKERVLGVVIDGKAKVYQFDHFPGEEISILRDVFLDQDLVVVGSTGKNFLVAFSVGEDAIDTNFTLVQNEFPIVMKDQLGNKYNLFGEVVEGPSNIQLESPINYMGYWFSWGTFYPGVQIFE